MSFLISGKTAADRLDFYFGCSETEQDKVESCSETEQGNTDFEGKLFGNRITISQTKAFRLFGNRTHILYIAIYSAFFQDIKERKSRGKSGHFFDCVECVIY
jgi:hypothetical protein